MILWSVCLCLSQECFFCIITMFGMIIMLKNEASSSQMFSSWWMKICQYNPTPQAEILLKFHICHLKLETETVTLCDWAIK